MYRRWHARLLLDYMTSVNDCVIKMTVCVNIVIDNADVYVGNGSMFGGQIKRHAPPGERIYYASTDIDDIIKAAIKCIDIIDMHAIPK